MNISSERQQRLDDICRRYHIRRLDLFGSAATDSMRADSDVDVLVEFVPGEAPSAFRLVDLQDELSAVFDGRRIDLAFPTILNNPFRCRGIEPQLQNLYA
jgi:predicted nucleotidyltransferase